MLQFPSGAQLPMRQSVCPFGRSGALTLKVWLAPGVGENADFGVIGLEQNFLERLGVKGIFHRASIVPRINDQDFVLLERRNVDDAVVAPILNGRAVRIRAKCNCR